MSTSSYDTSKCSGSWWRTNRKAIPGMQEGKRQWQKDMWKGPHAHTRCRRREMYAYLFYHFLSSREIHTTCLSPSLLHFFLLLFGIFLFSLSNFICRLFKRWFFSMFLFYPACEKSENQGFTLPPIFFAAGAVHKQPFCREGNANMIPIPAHVSYLLSSQCIRESFCGALLV